MSLADIESRNAGSAWSALTCLVHLSVSLIMELEVGKEVSLNLNKKMQYVTDY